MFITFEGIDGSGKSTQIELLRDKLESEGRKVAVFREPGGTVLSEQIREVLLHTEGEMHPVTEILLFSAARSQLISEKVLPLLKEDTIVILDRFFDSTTAYQGYGRNVISLEDVHELNRLASHELLPDATFYLRLSLEQAQNRTRGSNKDRMERSGTGFYNNVIRGFDILSETEERFITIDASGNPQQIYRQIWSYLSNQLDLDDGSTKG